MAPRVKLLVKNLSHFLTVPVTLAKLLSFCKPQFPHP